MPDAYPGDNVLLQRIGDGDSDALLLLHKQYVNLVYSMARRVVGDAQVAEEITQDVFLKLWQKSSRYDPGRGRFSTWLLAMARFAAIDRLRQDGRRPPASAEIDDSSDDPNVDRGAYLDHKAWEQGQHLRLLVQQLPAEQQQILELAYFAGMTHSELAEHLNLPLGTVKGRLRLGLEKLRSLWLDDLSKDRTHH
jgi:RNA polymerase sigma-70 factor, ECF subfamily